MQWVVSAACVHKSGSESVPGPTIGQWCRHIHHTVGRSFPIHSANCWMNGWMNCKLQLQIRSKNTVAIRLNGTTVLYIPPAQSAGNVRAFRFGIGSVDIYPCVDDIGIQSHGSILSYAKRGKHTLSDTIVPVIFALPCQKLFRKLLPLRPVHKIWLDMLGSICIWIWLHLAVSICPFCVKRFAVNLFI